jgi:rubredoxin
MIRYHCENCGHEWDDDIGAGECPECGSMEFIEADEEFDEELEDDE